MKVELTDEQQKMLISLIENTNFSGKDAEVIVGLKNALKNSEQEEKLSEKALEAFRKDKIKK